MLSPAPSKTQPRPDPAPTCAPSAISFYVSDRDKISTRTCIPQSVNHIKCHRGRGKAYFFVHSLAVIMNAPLSFFNCCNTLCRSGSPLSTLTTYCRYLRFKRVIGARIIHLFLDDGKHCSNSHTSIRCGSPVFLTCGKSDGRLPLKVSYSTTCSHQQEIGTHLISQNRDAYTSLLIDPRMVDLSGERHLGRITNVSRRAVIQRGIRHTVGALNGKSSGSASLKENVPPLYGLSDCTDLSGIRGAEARITHRSLYRTLPVKQITLGRLICNTLDRVCLVYDDYPRLFDGHAHRVDCYSDH
jgi:hypothetical protein